MGDKNKYTGNVPDPDENRITPDAKDAAEKEPDPAGLDPTRFGDWEKNGRCIDF